MPKGIPNPKPELEAVEEYDAYSPRTQAQTEPKKYAIRLDRHYRPAGEFEVVGYHKPEVRVKKPSGEWEVVEQEEFIKGEVGPAPLPGVNIQNKIWAGTVIRLDEEEARTVQKLRIGALDFAD